MKEQRSTDARDRRTALFIEDRQAFIGLLRNELHQLDYDAETRGMQVAVRLNGTSDLHWPLEHPELFEEFPYMFYDYTKRIDLMENFLAGTFRDSAGNEKPWPSRYSITFSLSERNAHHAKRVLEMGGNVAAVFWPELPTAMFGGFPVINGDKTDFRPADKSPAVVGLLAKGWIAREDNLSGFVIRTDKLNAHQMLNANYAA